MHHWVHYKLEDFEEYSEIHKEKVSAGSSRKEIITTEVRVYAQVLKSFPFERLPFHLVCLYMLV